MNIQDDNECVYTVYVRTSKAISGGTDAKISVAFYDSTGYGVLVKDLEAWGGLMGKDHDYYERGNLDIFSGRGPCLDKPVCSMELTSDGTAGSHHTPDWYCNYVEVTTTGPHIDCAQQLFTVEQWLSPDKLTVSKDSCNYSNGIKPRRQLLLPVETLLAASSSAAAKQLPLDSIIPRSQF